jgi:hypothetical protein
MNRAYYIYICIYIYIYYAICIGQYSLQYMYYMSMYCREKLRYNLLLSYCGANKESLKIGTQLSPAESNFFLKKNDESLCYCGPNKVLLRKGTPLSASSTMQARTRCACSVVGEQLIFAFT